MFRIAGKPVLVDEMLLLTELKSQLEANGKNLFHKFKPSSGNIQFCCPIHKDGQERKPSCGVSTQDKKVNGKLIPAGTVNCFTCGYTASLEEMISNCFGYDDRGEFGKQWVLKNFVTTEAEDREVLDLDLSRSANVDNQKFVSEEELDTYRFYHDYMYKRKLTDVVIEKFDIGFDHKTNCLTFPVRDINGNTLFVALRSVATKYFHYPEDVDKPLYGVFELPKNCKEVIVCESIFNALTCWVYGRPAIALMGLGSSAQYEMLNKLPVRSLVIALDPDKEGTRATEKIQRHVKHKIISLFVYPEYMYENKLDINDLTKEEFDSLLESY
jgi:hypothetical protein